MDINAYKTLSENIDIVITQKVKEIEELENEIIHLKQTKKIAYRKLLETKPETNICG